MAEGKSVGVAFGRTCRQLADAALEWVESPTPERLEKLRKLAPEYRVARGQFLANRPGTKLRLVKPDESG